jgi:hypothetical protein
MKRISIDLPSAAKLVDGLTPREVHPRLGTAEEAVFTATRQVEVARLTLEARASEVATLPARISRGEAPAGELADALRRRDAASLMIAPAQRALDAARAAFDVETTAARRALEREVLRRREILARAVEQLAPTLDELRDLELALSRVLDGANVGLGIEWPRALSDEITLGNMRMSFHAATTTGIQTTVRHERPGER